MANGGEWTQQETKSPHRDAVSPQTENEPERRTAQQTPEPAMPEVVHRTLGQLTEVGRVWAGYGLHVGRSALEQASRTLSVAARHVGDAAERVDRDLAERTRRRDDE